MKGILLFAFNGGFDYVRLAILCAKRIKMHIDLPITLITDSKNYVLENYQDSSELFDLIIDSYDETKQLKMFNNTSKENHVFYWKNYNRVLSYDLTPYDQTLVIDVDYVVCSDFLQKCFDIDSDFLIFKDYYNLSTWRNNYQFDYISNFSIPFYWATVFLFKKNEKNKLFFTLLKFIQKNWDYYRLLYQINQPLYRNDYAFSIALHIISGYYPKSSNNCFPGKIYFAQDNDMLIKSSKHSLLFLLEKENCLDEYVPLKIQNIDIHVMNKFSILENLS